MKNKSSKLEIAPAEKPTKKLARTRRPRSLKQVEASRRNGEKSCGPLTRAGKRRSRANAFVHGLYASVLPPFDTVFCPRTQFDEVLAALSDEYKPRSQHAVVLLERYAVDLVRLRAVMAMWSYEQRPTGSAASTGPAPNPAEKAAAIAEAEQRLHWLERALQAARTRTHPNLPEAGVNSVCLDVFDFIHARVNKLDEATRRRELNRARRRQIYKEIAASRPPVRDHHPMRARLADLEVEARVLRKRRSDARKAVLETAAELVIGTDLHGVQQAFTAVAVHPPDVHEKIARTIEGALRAVRDEVEEVRLAARAAYEETMAGMQAAEFNPDRVEILMRMEAHLRRACDRDFAVFQHVLALEARVRSEKQVTPKFDVLSQLTSNARRHGAAGRKSLGDHWAAGHEFASPGQGVDPPLS